MTGTPATRRASAFLPALMLGLAAAGGSAGASVAPPMQRARPAVVDKAVRSDPMRARKRQPRAKPNDLTFTDYDALRVDRAQTRRARRRTRAHGWTP